MLGAAIVHPDFKEVIPLCPEMIINQDGATKNDCERNAYKRFFEQLRKDQPSLPLIVNADALSPNAPHELTVMAVEDIHKKKKDNGMRFTGHRDSEKRSGTIIALFRENARRPLIYGLGESVSKPAPFPKLN